jgi:hypothetical protein
MKHILHNLSLCSHPLLLYCSFCLLNFACIIHNLVLSNYHHIKFTDIVIFMIVILGILTSAQYCDISICFYIWNICLLSLIVCLELVHFVQEDCGKWEQEQKRNGGIWGTCVPLILSLKPAIAILTFLGFMNISSLCAEFCPQMKLQHVVEWKRVKWSGVNVSAVKIREIVLVARMLSVIWE